MHAWMMWQEKYIQEIFLDVIKIIKKEMLMHFSENHKQESCNKGETNNV